MARVATSRSYVLKHGAMSMEGDVCRFAQDVLELRDSFLDLCAHIAVKFGVNGASAKAVASLLMESICERFVLEKWRFHGAGADEVDRIWRNLHDYAVLLLVERLKNRLLESGLLTAIVGEAESPSGRYDVLVLVNGGSVRILNGGGSISLEVKTGLNVSLCQLERYLWNGVTVILLRFATGDIVVLKPDEWAGLMKSALADRIEKAKRILAGAPVITPGKDCFECPLKGCRFNKWRGSNGLRRPKRLDELLKRFVENAYPAIEMAVNIIVEELSAAQAKISTGNEVMHA